MPTFWLVSIVSAVVPADWIVRAVAAGLVTVVVVTVPVNVGLAVRAIVPVAAGNVIVFDPAADGGDRVMLPEVAPLRTRLPIRQRSKSIQTAP